MTPFTYENRGRSWNALITLAVIYGLLILLMRLINLSPMIAGGVALFTLPALYELLTDPASGLTLDETQVSWFTQRTDGALPLANILHARFDTRLDLSVKVTFVLKNGRKIRLPHAATPPHYAFEEALKERSIMTERHHFSFIG